MSKLFTRRRMLTASGGVALSPLALGAQRAAAARRRRAARSSPCSRRFASTTHDPTSVSSAAPSWPPAAR